MAYQPRLTLSPTTPVGRLRIIAEGSSPSAQANARGKLFEQLMATLLTGLGYDITGTNTNYSGMEIDIEAKSSATGVPLYCECKCYENNVDSPKFQAFTGKLWTRIRRNPRSQGLFVAIPGINGSTRAFFNDNFSEEDDIAFSILEEKDVLQSLVRCKLLLSSESYRALVPPVFGIPGDWLAVYTKAGFYWIQYIIPTGSNLANSIIVFNSVGECVTSRPELDAIYRLLPEIGGFEQVSLDDAPTMTQGFTRLDDEGDVVEVRGSSSYFEYEFPASPAFFVGRASQFRDVDRFFNEVLQKSTSARGLVIEANSGWGKSSLALSVVERLNSNGHFAISIDSRTVNSARFLLRVIEHFYRKFDGFGGLIVTGTPTITGFDGAIDAIVGTASTLEQHNRLILIHFDQFENVFAIPEALSKIKDFVLRVSDASTNILIGFSWKSDLVGLASEFPFQTRDIIQQHSRRISLDRFSEADISSILESLSRELNAPLRRDLRFQLAEISQGFPWLLKKLCAHVASLRSAGHHQVDIATTRLNVEELFRKDLDGLTAEEEESLRGIARLAPVMASDIGDICRPSVVQVLVNKRLLVRVGAKYDIYWDIFKDYLRNGILPALDNYILRVQASSVVSIAQILHRANDPLEKGRLQSMSGMSERSFWNVLRDMRLLGLIEEEDATVSLSSPLQERDLLDGLAVHLRAHLRRNRLVVLLLEEMEKGDLSIEDAARLLSDACPYISAIPQTWRTYALIFADWMSACGLCTMDPGTSTMAVNSDELDAPTFRNSRRHRESWLPHVQYRPTAQLWLYICQEVSDEIPESNFETLGLTRSTLRKALNNLTGLGLIERSNGTLKLISPRGITSLHAAAEAVPAMEAFIGVLMAYDGENLTIAELASAVREAFGTAWTDGTAEFNTKILLDWARYLGKAPQGFSGVRRKDRSL